MAFREPIADLIIPATEDTPKRTPLVGMFKVEDSNGNVLLEGENKIVTVAQNDMLKVGMPRRLIRAPERIPGMIRVGEANRCHAVSNPREW